MPTRSAPAFKPIDGARYYHWPTVDTTQEWQEKPLGAEGLETVQDRIESFFADRLGVPALLIPSARAGLSLLLEHHGIERGNTVFAPQWSPHCIWDVITRTATPRSRLDRTVDVALAVHQWGRLHDVPPDVDAIVIEDSVDSLLTDGDTLFHNGSRYELLSLPKLIGSYTGGVILFRETADAHAVRESASPVRGLGHYQSQLRHRETRGENTGRRAWAHLEHRNRSLEGNALRNIEACLPYYIENADTIRDRLDWLDHQDLPDEHVPSTGSRLPPVAPFVTDKDGVGNDLLHRHLNVTGDLGDPCYSKAALVPLHFGVTAEFFQHTVSLVCDALDA